MVCTEQSEAAALGAAIQAAWCVSAGTETLEDLCQRCVRLESNSQTDPDPTHVLAYEQAYQRYREQVGALTE